MFNFYSISSSSSGNCLLIQTTKTNILVDIGISVKKINSELGKLDLSLENIDSILVTHEHSDHIKGLATLYNKYDIPIYASAGTIKAIQKRYSIPKEYINIIDVGEKFKINDVTINSFDIPHDAIQPCGYTFSKNKKKITVATDIGCIDDKITTAIENSNFAFLESNYDTNMLSAGKYPYILKRRIASNIGHLSNEQCSNLINHLAKGKTKTFMLGHLSKENNIPDLAIQTITSELLSNKIDINSINISVALRDCLSNKISLEDD